MTDIITQELKAVRKLSITQCVVNNGFMMKLKTSELALLQSLCHYSNYYTGACWPCLDSLAAFSNLQRKSVILGLKSLESKGILIRVNRFKTNEKGKAWKTSNLYVISFKNFTEKEWESNSIQSGVSYETAKEAFHLCCEKRANTYKDLGIYEIIKKPKSMYEEHSKLEAEYVIYNAEKEGIKYPCNDPTYVRKMKTKIVSETTHKKKGLKEIFKKNLNTVKTTLKPNLKDVSASSLNGAKINQEISQVPLEENQTPKFKQLSDFAGKLNPTKKCPEDKLGSPKISAKYSGNVSLKDTTPEETDESLKEFIANNPKVKPSEAAFFFRRCVGSVYGSTFITPATGRTLGILKHLLKSVQGDIVLKLLYAITHEWKLYRGRLNKEYGLSTPNQPTIVYLSAHLTEIHNVYEYFENFGQDEEDLEYVVVPEGTNTAPLEKGLHAYDFDSEEEYNSYLKVQQA